MLRLVRLIAIAWILVAAAHRVQAKPLADQGVIDLTGWNSQDSLRLDGTWQFFPNTLMEPEAYLQRLSQPNLQTQWARMGQSFAEASHGSMKNFGFATFVLRVKGLPSGRKLGITGMTAYTAARVYYFNAAGHGSSEPLLVLGRVAKNAADSGASVGSVEIVEIPSDMGAEGYFLVQISNYQHRWGGFWLPPMLGDFKILTADYQSDLKRNYFVIGVLMFTSIYSFSLYSRRREDKGSLLLGFLCLLLVVRSIGYLGGNDPIISPPNLNFNVTFKFIYLSMIGAPLLFLHFLIDYFPGQTPRRLVSRITYAVTPLIVFIIVSPANLFTIVGTFGQYLSMAMGGFCMFCLGRAFLAGERGAGLSNLGAYAVFVGGVLDMLTAFGYGVFPTNCVGYGLVIFTMAQSQIIGVRFAVAFRKARHLGRSLQEEVDRQTREIKSIMQSIELGIFTLVNEDLQVGDQFSKHLTRITKEDQLAGRSIEDILLKHSNISRDASDQILSALRSSIQSDLINFDMNSHCLVPQITFQKQSTEPARTLELEWTPIVNSENRVEKVLVCLRDVTDLIQLKQKASDQEADLRMISELISVAEDRFHRFLMNCRQLLAQCRQILQTTDSKARSSVLRHLFMNMHTLKGMARTYHFLTLSAAAHDAEQRYAQLQKDQISFDINELQKDIDRVSGILNHYESMGRQLGWALGERILKIRKTAVETVLDDLSRLPFQNLDQPTRRFLEKVEFTLGHECHRPIQEIILDACKGIDSLARDLSKVPPLVEIDPRPLFMKDQGADLIHSIMSHLMRNAIDHGLETDDDRHKSGKASQGRIVVKIDDEQEQMVLQFFDDGRGLNIRKIADLAQKRGLMDPHEVWPDERYAEQIFLSGFSTSSSVTEISGRGVGMDAVRSLLQAQQGDIAIAFTGLQDGQGFRPFAFLINFPKTLCWVPQASALPLAG